MRARIALRKAGIAFVAGDAHEIQEMENVRKKRGIKLEPKDVVEALSRGDEVCTPLWPHIRS
jgi:hypothetical protein